MKNYKVMDPGSGALRVGTANLVQAPINKWHVAERRLKARARLEAHEIKTPKTWPHVPMRSRLDGDRKTWDQRLICVINLAKEQWDLVFFFFWKKKKGRNLFWCGSYVRKFGHGSMNMSSWMALIPCKRPESNDNGKYKREIEREEENGG